MTLGGRTEEVCWSLVVTGGVVFGADGRGSVAPGHDDCIFGGEIHSTLRA